MTTTTPQKFWTSFSPILRTELRNAFSTDEIGALIENPTSSESRGKISTIAAKFLQQKKFQSAEELYLWYYETRISELKDKQNIDTLFALYNVAYAQLEQHSYENSEHTWRKLSKVSKTSNAESFVQNLGAESNLGFVLNKQQKYQEAEEVLAAVLPKMTALFHDNDPRLLGCIRHLIEALAGQEKMEEARELWLRGMEMAKTAQAPHTVAEIEAMMEVHEMIERPE